MKIIYKTGIAGILALILNLKIANAQEQNINERVGAQFVNNKVPGLKYGPEKSAGKEKTEKSKIYTKGNFKTTLDDGKSQPGTAAVPRSAQKSISKTARTAQKPLTSDQAALKKEQQKIEPPKPPSQGNEKE